MNTSVIGRAGEAAAAEYLRKKGYTVLEAGYRCRYGEIDLIARKKELVIIAEVKTRKNDRFAQAMEFVDAHKQNRLRLTARHWLMQQETEFPLRFDVIEVYANGEIRHIPDAFQ